MKTERTLTIVVEAETEFHDRVRESLAEIESDGGGSPKRLLSIPDTAALDRILSEPNLTLIQTIATETPESMRETARLVGRDIKDVSRNLHELAELGVIEFERVGQSKRPGVWYDEIDVKLSVRAEPPDGNRTESTP